MPEKDITEKILMNHNDVFADIINGLVFRGEQKIKATELENASVHSQYKDQNDTIHEQERDVAKFWKENNAKISLLGIENQTCVEPHMPFRILGYDGASYKEQLMTTRGQVYPVVTIVLYFGTKKRWIKPRNIKSYLAIPPELEAFVNDYQVYICEIAWLKEEEIECFQSDFKVVANFFRNKRKNRNYIPDDKTEIKYVDEVLKLLSVMTKDRRYEKILSGGEGREVHSMCDVAERLEQRGKEEGRAEGRLEIILELVRDHILTVQEAAKRLDIDEKELLEKI